MEAQDAPEQGPAPPRLEGWGPEPPEAFGHEAEGAVDLALPGLVAALGPADEDSICVAFSGGGLRLVSGGMDERACVWDLVQAQALALEKVHTDTVVCLAQGRLRGPPDAATTAAEIAAFGPDLPGLAGPAGEGGDAAFNDLLYRQPALVYTAGLDGQVCALSTYNYTLVASASTGSPVEWLEVHGVADYALVGTSDGVAYLYDFTAAARRASREAVQAVQASLAAGGSPVALPGGAAADFPAAPSAGLPAGPVGEPVAPATPTAPAAPAGPLEASLVAAYCGHDGSVSAGLFTYSHKYVVTGCTDGMVRLFRALSGECLSKVALRSEVSCMALVPPDPQDRKKKNGTVLAGLDSGELAVLSVSGDKLFQAGQSQPHQKRIERILVCQRRYVVLGSLDGALSVLDARSNYGVRSVVNLGEPVTALCYANWGARPERDPTACSAPPAAPAAPAPAPNAFAEASSLPVVLAGTSAGNVYAIRLLDGRVLYGCSVFAPNPRFGRPAERPVLDVAWARPRGLPGSGRHGYMAVAGDLNVYVWSCDPGAYPDNYGGSGEGGGGAPGGALGAAGAGGEGGGPAMGQGGAPGGEAEDSKDGADGIDGGELDY